MRPRARVIKFPGNGRPSRRYELSATVIILPVIRIESYRVDDYDDAAPKRVPRFKRRKKN